MSQDPNLPDDLLSRLRRSPAPELRRLVETYGRFFGMPEVRQMLLNPFVDGESLEELATIRTLSRVRAVQAALCRHHRTPESVAMRFLPHLFWRELLEITVHIRIRAAVRRAAERYLLERLPRLTLGEKVALARRAVPSTLGPLVLEGNPGILGAALDNPRATEEALIPLLRHPEAPSKALAQVAAHPRWGTRYEVMVALCRNARTPFGVLQESLPKLGREDLEGVLMVGAHSALVHLWAREELERKTPKGSSAGLEWGGAAEPFERWSSVDVAESDNGEEAEEESEMPEDLDDEEVARRFMADPTFLLSDKRSPDH